MEAAATISEIEYKTVLVILEIYEEVTATISEMNKVVAAILEIFWKVRRFCFPAVSFIFTIAFNSRQKLLFIIYIKIYMLVNRIHKNKIKINIIRKKEKKNLLLLLCECVNMCARTKVYYYMHTLTANLF